MTEQDNEHCESALPFHLESGSPVPRAVEHSLQTGLLCMHWQADFLDTAQGSTVASNENQMGSQKLEVYYTITKAGPHTKCHRDKKKNTWNGPMEVTNIETTRCLSSHHKLLGLTGPRAKRSVASCFFSLFIFTTDLSDSQLSQDIIYKGGFQATSLVIDSRPLKSRQV